MRNRRKEGTEGGQEGGKAGEKKEWRCQRGSGDGGVRKVLEGGGKWE